MATPTLDFENMVASYLCRDAVLFSIGTPPDKMLASLNMARQWAQRMHKFEYLKVMAELSVDQTTGGLISACKLYGTATAVEPRAVLRAYLTAADGSGLYPIDVITRHEQAEQVRQFIEGVATTSITAFIDPYARPKLYQFGSTLYLWPWPSETLTGSSATVILDIVKWLTDLDGTEETADFFITYCYDWLLYRTAFHANYFLKDDQRVIINANVIKDAWESVMEWDKDIVMGTVPITLD